MRAMATTPPTTPPAIAPVGVEDFEEEEEEVGEGEVMATGVAAWAVEDVWVEEVAWVVLDVEDCEAPPPVDLVVADAGLTLVVCPFLAIQTPEPVLQHSFALEPTPQQ